MTSINLAQRSVDELCTFEMSKRIKNAGLTCANTYFAYDNDGKLNDGACMENIGIDNLYPCVTFSFAVNMLEGLDFGKIECYQTDTCTYINYNGKQFSSTNIVDAVLELWLFTINK